MRDRTLLLGRPGSGKTTFLRNTIDWLGEYLDTLIVATPTNEHARHLLGSRYDKATGRLTEHPHLDLQITTLSRPVDVKESGRTLAVVDEAELNVLDSLVNHLKCEIIATATVPGEMPYVERKGIHPYDRDHNRLGLTVAFAIDNAYRIKTLGNWRTGE